MEHLHLFTEVKGWKPDEDGRLWVCLDKDFQLSLRLHKRGYKWHGTIDPVYVLDLSKLTTKERAVEAAEQVYNSSMGLEDGSIDYLELMEEIKNSL